jgi:hypothetical protein
MNRPSYLFPPSFRQTLLAFLASRPRDDATVSMLQQRVQQLDPSYVIDHGLCQSCVDYLKKLPYEQVFQIIHTFGVLEAIDKPLLPQPIAADPDVRIVTVEGNGASEVVS